MTEKLLTPEQAAEVLQIRPDTVRSWLRSGILPGAKIGPGRVWRIRSADLETFIEKDHQKGGV